MSQTNNSRIAYVDFKPLKQYSRLKAIRTLPFNRQTSIHFMSFIKTVWKNFYILQQKQNLGITKIPVLHVDHPLDASIPFKPKTVKVYLDFVSFFGRIFSMLLSKLNHKVAIKYCIQYIDFLRDLYKEAGTVYSHTLTTTNRPHYKRSLGFFIIHMFDPHFLCIPSLHVSIVAGSYAFIRDVFNQSDVVIDSKEKEELLYEIYTGAVAITETVLYVKQHSINCVCGAFYMLHNMTQMKNFKNSDVLMFIGSLFNYAQDISETHKTEIKNYMYEMYTKLAAARLVSETWQQPLFDWFESFSSQELESFSLS